jgi:predicted TIM-barrel fold metal-dependent hydrolase
LFRSSVLDHPNVYLEMSSAASAHVYELTLSRRDLWDRLMFGSDVPFGLITGTEYWSEPHGPVFLPRDDYAWSDPELNARFANERRGMTYNTYHTIAALKQAMDRLNLAKAEEEKLKSAIFAGNAQRFLSDVASR